MENLKSLYNGDQRHTIGENPMINLSYSILAVTMVSFISLIGVFAISLKVISGLDLLKNSDTGQVFWFLIKQISKKESE